MTLQPSQQHKVKLCKRCGAEIVYKDNVALDPFFNNEPHNKYCMYSTAASNPDIELMLLDFLSMVPKQKRVIGAVGRAK